MLVGRAQNGHQLFIATRETHLGLRRIAIGMFPARKEGYRRCLCEGLRREAFEITLPLSCPPLGMPKFFADQHLVIMGLFKL